jgi:hypothetical protein
VPRACSSSLASARLIVVRASASPQSRSAGAWGPILAALSLIVRLSSEIDGRRRSARSTGAGGEYSLT